MEKLILEQVAEIIPDVPVEAIVVPQIIEEDGKRYEVTQSPGCISRLCLDDAAVPADAPEPTLQEQVKILSGQIAQVAENLGIELSAESGGSDA